MSDRKERYIEEVLGMFPQWDALKDDIRVLLEKTWDTAVGTVSKIESSVTLDQATYGRISREFIAEGLSEGILSEAFLKFGNITETTDPVSGSTTMHGELMVIAWR